MNAQGVLIAERPITCPSCWESIDITIDLSVPEQEYIEDCQVCCRPIRIRYSADDGELVELSVSGESDA